MPEISVATRDTLDPAWAHLPPLHLGPVSPAVPPAWHVILLRADRPTLRCDVHRDPERDLVVSRSEALLWSGLLAVGYGRTCHFIDLERLTVHPFALDGGAFDYFMGFHPQEGDLLIASGTDLRRLGRDLGLIWRAANLAVDGVCVGAIEGGVIYGDGERDPPGGWVPFAVDWATGAVLADGT